MFGRTACLATPAITTVWRVSLHPERRLRRVSADHGRQWSAWMPIDRQPCQAVIDSLDNLTEQGRFVHRPIAPGTTAESFAPLGYRVSGGFFCSRLTTCPVYFAALEALLCSSSPGHVQWFASRPSISCRPQVVTRCGPSYREGDDHVTSGSDCSVANDSGGPRVG